MLPALIMIVGVSLTSIDMFQQSDSRIIDPSRVADMPGAQKVLFDSHIHRAGSDVSVTDFVERFPG